LDAPGRNSRWQVAEALPRFVAELVGQAEAARHDEVEDLVWKLLDRNLGCVGGEQVSRLREHQLRLVVDPRVARRQREALAAVPVLIDVAVVGDARIPALGQDRHAALQARRDLDDRRRRLHGIESELAAHGEVENLRARKSGVAYSRSVCHPVENGMFAIRGRHPRQGPRGDRYG
jgi:hypothetical protein